MRNLIRDSIFMFIILAFLAISCTNSDKQTRAYGSTAPDFQLPDLNNQTFTLSTYKGKQPVLLFFWTTWCPFCRQELLRIKDEYEKLNQDGLLILIINVGESPQRVESFLKNYNLNFNVLLDQDTKVARSFELFGVPTYIIIDRKGDIAFRGYRFPDQEYKEIISR